MNLTPGIYKGTVRGVPDVTFIVRESYTERAASMREVDGYTFHNLHYDIADARRLYTLDLEGTPPEVAIRNLVRDSGSTATIIAAQIEAQIPKPPRMDEPDLWGVVSARLSRSSSERFNFVHDNDGWICTEDGGVFAWASLIDPVLIREGVQS